MNLLFKHFQDSFYNSHNSGILIIAIKAAKKHIGFSFEILNELRLNFLSELEFHRIETNLFEKANWDKMLFSLPLREEKKIRLKGQGFKLKYRENGKYFSLVIENNDGDVVFTDGPRKILFKSNAQKSQLSSSVTTTYSDPKLRGVGLYQYALQYYFKKHKVNRGRLYSENEETLEFIYRMKSILYDAKLREQLLAIDGLQEYLRSHSIDIDYFRLGKVNTIKKAENALALLSLQGRTRLNLGMDFKVGQSYPAIIISDLISTKSQRAHKQAIKKLEMKIQNQLHSGNPEIQILPKAYLKKFNSNKSCKNLLKKS